MGGGGEVGNEREREEKERGKKGERERKDVKMEGKEKWL